MSYLSVEGILAERWFLLSAPEITVVAESASSNRLDMRGIELWAYSGPYERSHVLRVELQEVLTAAMQLEGFGAQKYWACHSEWL